jgi:hypothetical protein
MLKNIIKSYKLIKQSNFQIVRNLTSKNNADLDDEFKYQNDESTGIRNLEKLGIAKPYWSWPQYNRVIYPPTEDGKPMINPVGKIL